MISRGGKALGARRHALAAALLALLAGRGKDHLFAPGKKNKVNGGPGVDRCKHTDFVKNCEVVF